MGGAIIFIKCSLLFVYGCPEFKPSGVCNTGVLVNIFIQKESLTFIGIPCTKYNCIFLLFFKKNIIFS